MPKNKQYCKFPENKKLAEELRYGDQLKIKKMTGYKLNYIRLIFSGQKRLPPKVAKAAMKLIEEHRYLDNKLKKFIRKNQLDQLIDKKDQN